MENRPASSTATTAGSTVFPRRQGAMARTAIPHAPMKINPCAISLSKTAGHPVRKASPKGQKTGFFSCLAEVYREHTCPCFSRNPTMRRPSSAPAPVKQTSAASWGILCGGSRPKGMGKPRVVQPGTPVWFLQKAACQDEGGLGDPFLLRRLHECSHRAAAGRFRRASLPYRRWRQASPGCIRRRSAFAQLREHSPR